MCEWVLLFFVLRPFNRYGMRSRVVSNKTFHLLAIKTTKLSKKEKRQHAFASEPSLFLWPYPLHNGKEIRGAWTWNNLFSFFLCSFPFYFKANNGSNVQKLPPLYTLFSLSLGHSLFRPNSSFLRAHTHSTLVFFPSLLHTKLYLKFYCFARFIRFC